jgi:hypothetical protein
MPEPEDGAPAPEQMIGIEVSKVDSKTIPGVTFRPGMVYQVKAAVRDKLEAAGSLKKD